MRREKRSNARPARSGRKRHVFLRKERNGRGWKDTNGSRNSILGLEEGSGYISYIDRSRGVPLEKFRVDKPNRARNYNASRLNRVFF